MELYYRRGESTHKGKAVPARVETVVLFLPDVWSCLPTRLEWDNQQQTYRKQLERLLGPGEQQEPPDDGPAADEKALTTFFSPDIYTYMSRCTPEPRSLRARE